MKMIVAIIRPTKLDEVRNALADIEVQGITVSEVKGFGRQKGHIEMYRGSAKTVDFLPKIKLEIAVSEPFLEKTLEVITSVARTDSQGKIGDGKIFVSNLEQVIRIRTGETNLDAL
ncbi:Nitrogen regulatory protein P-II [hydrothermal vent metagenome]|uniref:Nitrogen regulatory protein P-II n=1 Tax=hydrothermal vent metagenome TaxID=652676 RepID=A0A1W1CPR8_9ZZZZ